MKGATKMRPLDPSALPDDTVPRIRALIDRSAPDKQKPSLPQEIEDGLAEGDRTAAGTYAELEEMTYRTNRLAEQLHAEHQRKG